MKIFTDTGAFIALTDADDENHKAARTFYQGAKGKGALFVTTNCVICETVNYLRARVSHNSAVFFRENIKKSGIIRITAVTPLIEDAAFDIFKNYEDKAFSFTDCTSFAVMKALKLHRAFAFDKHFEQYGNFEQLP